LAREAGRREKTLRDAIERARDKALMTGAPVDLAGIIRTASVLGIDLKSGAVRLKPETRKALDAAIAATRRSDAVGC
jgi:hypothetical protein